MLRILVEKNHVGSETAEKWDPDRKKSFWIHNTLELTTRRVEKGDPQLHGLPDSDP
jgi:hypothetical protein